MPLDGEAALYAVRLSHTCVTQTSQDGHTHTHKSFQGILLLVHVSPQNSAAEKSCTYMLRYLLINGLVDEWMDGPMVGFLSPQCPLLDPPNASRSFVRL